MSTSVCVRQLGTMESAPNKNFGSMCFQLMLQNGSVGVVLLQGKTSIFFHEWIGSETKTHSLCVWSIATRQPEMHIKSIFHDRTTSSSGVLVCTIMKTIHRRVKSGCHSQKVQQQCPSLSKVPFLEALSQWSHHSQLVALITCYLKWRSIPSNRSLLLNSFW